MKSKLIICALLTAFIINIFAFGTQSRAATYVETVYNEQNGLPTGEANTVLQTRDGYIWIGSYGGLIRCDGSSFRNYSTEGLISSSSIRSLFEDSAGRLWIGTNDAGVFLYENKTFTHIKSPGNYSFLCIRDFAEDESGKIYIASTSGIGEINGGEIKAYDAEGLLGETVYSIACDPLGRVWAAMNSGKCAVVKDGTPEKIMNLSEVFSDAEIYCVASDPDGKIWLGSSADKIAVLKFSDNGSFEKQFFTAGNVVTHNRIQISEDGTAVICGEHGFAVMDMSGNVIMENSPDKPVPANDAFIDYEGNIWLASSNFGAVKYTDGCISPLSGVSGIAVNAVTRASGNFYIAHDNGLSVVTANGREVKNELTEMLSGVRIRQAITDSKDRVWLSTYSDHGVVRYDPKSGEITEFNTENGLISNRARAVLEIGENAYAVATQEGVNIIKNDAVAESYGSKDGLSVAAILCMAYDPDGTLYMGSDGGGVFALKDGKITSHGFDEDLEEGVVLRMLRDEESGGYFVSAGSNLYFRDSESGRFTKLQNFKKGAGSIFDFFLYNGKLWLLQNNGIICLDKSSLLSGEFTEGKEYSFQHGLSGSLNANTWSCLLEDTLYIATRNGVSKFGFSGVKRTLPKVVINSATVDGEVTEQPSYLSVSGNAGRVTVDFAALSYSGNSDFVISYMLEGFDKEPVVQSGIQSNSVSYTNLPGGEYKFVVKAYFPDDPNGAAVCELSVKKALKIYEYPAFWIAAAIILLGAAALVTYVVLAARLRAVRRRQEEYKNIVEQSLSTFAEAIDAKDKYTQGHSLRVAAYSRELARRMGLPDDEQERIYYIALLHDIGKIGIPDSILNKPDKLTPEEDEIIRTHPIIGGRILENFTAIKGITAGAKYHHERLDGKGYCEGLSGEQIPREARIIGVADTYDAMSSTRCYRKALPGDVIEEELRKISGTQLDPEVVRHMLDMIEEGVAPIEAESKLHTIIHKE